jgi:hypothetical protein
VETRKGVANKDDVLNYKNNHAESTLFCRINIIINDPCILIGIFH